MRRVWWVAKIALLVAAAYCIFAPGESYALRNVQAYGSCETTETCRGNSQGNCYCPIVTTDGPGCTGCFLPNNSPDCGSCSGGDNEAGI